ncbi:MAG: EamA family transporter [Acidimicrobiia bacterium]|nr:EamA family transporter [Acidimicrobiia bacterium]MYD04808.1 EamA family transporter [Acidimicrobiia bacterium]MYF27092.1 EamA family transporter [Acidimicrobiia bacterium]
MLIGSIFGMVTAVTLGVNNLLTAVVTRRFGVLRSTVFTLTLAFLVMIGWAVAIDVPFNIRADQVLFLGGLGAAAAGSFVGTYMALRLGPVSIVSPISALGGAVTVVYSYLWLGEEPSFLQWAGIAIAVIGAVLASLVIEAGAKIRLVTWGPVFAMIGVLVGAISNAGLKIPIQDGLDSNLTIITQRAFTVLYAALLFFVVTLWRKNRVTAGGGPFSEEGPDRVRLTWRNSWPLIVVGLIDAVSFVSFGYGLANAPAWLIGILSQSGRVIAVIGGVVFFKERLLGYQWTGVILVGIGVAMSIVG